MEIKKKLLFNGTLITPQNLPMYQFPDPDIKTFLLNWWNDETCIDLHTSGSTGEPKLIRSEKKYLLASANMTIEYFGLTKNDRILLNLPAKFIAGRMMLIRAIEAELNMTGVVPSGNPLEKIPEMSFDFGAMIPMQVYNSIETGQKNKLEKIKKLIIGGGEITGELQRMIAPLRNECFSTYGMTETYSHIALKKLNPLPETSYTLLKGVDAFPDERNCLVLNSEKLGVKNLVTNDIVEFTDFRKFRWIGRYDNIINSGGLKISPELIEEKLNSLINRRFIIGGIPDEKFGEKIVLIIEGPPFDQHTDQLFRDHLRSNLDKKEQPRELFFIGKLEETPTGKIKRKESIRKILMQQ